MIRQLQAKLKELEKERPQTEELVTKHLPSGNKEMEPSTSKKGLETVRLNRMKEKKKESSERKQVRIQKIN